MPKPSRVVTIEEHFDLPGAPGNMLVSAEALTDLFGKRIEDMDRCGVDLQVLSHVNPGGVQAQTDIDAADRMAKQFNDYVATVVARRPDRYAGFAAVPLQDPDKAARELERGVRDLGLKGAMVVNHINGVYLDDRRFDPFWAAAAELDVPVYIHPGNAPVEPTVTKGYSGLSGPIWGWAFEIGGHALRLVFGGVFDRHPKAKLIIGHMGEALPFFLWRIDSRYALYPQKDRMTRKPSEIIKEHIWLTTSGVFANDPLICAVSAFGAEKVIFSIDVPYESMEEGCAFLFNAPLSPSDLEKVAHGNAERLLRL